MPDCKFDIFNFLGAIGTVYGFLSFALFSPLKEKKEKRRLLLNELKSKLKTFHHSAVEYWDTTTQQDALSTIALSNKSDCYNVLSRLESIDLRPKSNLVHIKAAIRKYDRAATGGKFQTADKDNSSEAIAYMVEKYENANEAIDTALMGLEGTVFGFVFKWWRRGESNPRPQLDPR
tara:strand:+ start:16018 stop:16545 length:528 start_codon:yes stop_codon:yes gene_type:complete